MRALHRKGVAGKCGRVLSLTVQQPLVNPASCCVAGVTRGPEFTRQPGRMPYLPAGVAQFGRQLLSSGTPAAAASERPGPAAAAASAPGAEGADQGRPRVCILGGGFGGLYTAIKLELLMWPKGRKPQITLVDQGERFVFKPLLYELLNGTAQSWEVAPTFAQLLAPYPIQFVQDTVLSVDPEQTLADGGSAAGGVVQLASGRAVPYDWLVVALGAAADPRGVPGIRENARPFTSLSDAEYVAGRLAAIEAAAVTRGDQQQLQQPLSQQATVVVVGAGYAGVELAAVVAERMQGKAAVVLVTPGQCILEGAPPGQRQAAEEALRNLGVNIMTLTKVTAVQRAGQTAANAAPPAAAVTAAAAAAMGADGPGSARLDIPARPSSPEAAAVEPLAVLAATVAAASAGKGDQAAAAAAMNGSGPSAGSGDGAPNVTSSSGSGAGKDANAPTYVIKLEPTWGGGGSSSSSEMAADLVLWTAGSQPASRPLQPFPLSDRGQLETDATLRVLRHARVFALGDVSRGQYTPTGDGSGSSAGGGFYPATAQVAFQQADYAAWNIWAGINGRPLLPFRYQHLGDMMSLGATNAAVALPVQLPADVSATIAGSPLGSLLSVAGIKLGGTGISGQQQPGGLTVEGPLAQLLRRAAYLYRQPTNEQRLNVAASWIEQAVTIAARVAAEVSAASSSGSSGGSSSRNSPVSSASSSEGRKE